MQVKLLIIGILFFCSAGISAQEINGRITNEQGEPLPGVNVVIKGTTQGVVTDSEGYFILNIPEKWPVELLITSIGYSDHLESVDQNERGKSLNVILKESASELAEITVYGKSEAKELSEQPIAINSLSTQPILAQALGAEELLKTTTGVIVRQNGGLGSNLNINLNGLSGQRIRIYYDAIPIEVFAGGIQLNTFPIDAINRIDVYKGVLPIDIGTDALGGGINIVPKKGEADYLRTSYTFGSFNTHRFTLSSSKQVNNRLSLNALIFFNHSENDYEMRNIESITEETLPNGSIIPGPVETIDARRFHDRHISGFAELGARITGLTWADRLDFSSSYSFRNDQIQHGSFIFDTSVGEATSQINAFVQRIDYRKGFIGNRLNIRYFGVLSLSNDQIRDSTESIYNWRGQRLDITNAGGSELFVNPTLRNGNNLGTAHRLYATYALDKNLDLTFSEFFGHSRIKGEDPVSPRFTFEEEAIDPNSIPSTLTQNVFGLELKGKYLSNKLTPVVFYKHYFYNAEAIDILQVGATRVPVRKVKANNQGFGVALKYDITSGFFVRSSFERATRFPTQTEIFGDFASVLPNFELQAEESSNYNLGIQYEKFFYRSRQLFVRIDAYLRNQENLIRPEPFGLENTVFINEASVNGRGIEMASFIDPIRNLRLSGNFTLQSNRISSSDNEVPNIPLMFYNFGGRYAFKDVLRPGNNLQVFWNYFYTDEFSINEVPDLANADPRSKVPEQHIHNAGIVYDMEPEGLSLSFNLQNIFNAEVFDNFRIPRPGINYNFKISYSLLTTK